MTDKASVSLLDVEDLALSVPRRLLIRQLSLHIKPGDLWCILGANGAGKTLLLHTLAGVRPVNSGSISLAGRALDQWTLPDAARVRGLLPQSNHHAFPMPVLDAVITGRYPHLSRWGWEQDEDRARVHEALRAVGLSGLADRDITTLSGGERQRVAVAALLVQDVSLMLLDEPVAHLDLHHQVQVLQHLGELAQTGRAVMLSIHDLNLARRFATHAMLFHSDAEVTTGPVDEVMSDRALTEAFGHPVSCVTVGKRALFVAD